MDIFKQERREHRELGIATWLLTLLTIALGMLLLGCHKKPPVATITIYGDTARTKLALRVEQSDSVLVIKKNLTNQTVTDYEKAVIHFDSIVVHLPD